jgi:hypothetical protein
MIRKLINGLFVALAIVSIAVPAHASITQVTDSMDTPSAWHPDGTGSPFFSSGFETNVFPASAPHNAFVMLTTGSTATDWGTLGTNVHISTVFPGGPVSTCAASVKVTGNGFFEAIDTTTFTYLVPKVTFTGTNGTYKTITVGPWNPSRPDMFFRVGVAGGGTTHWVRFDDLVVQCTR